MTRLDARRAARVAHRERLGWTLEQAAHRARVCPIYLQRIEKHGRAPFVLAMRLSRLYSCDCHLFL